MRGSKLNERIHSLLPKGKSAWWNAGAGDESSSDDAAPIAKSYAALSVSEKARYFNNGVAMFPEVFGGDYKRFAPWLFYDCMVWCGNIRDIFSAGGTSEYEGIYFSAIMKRAIDNCRDIFEIITETPKDELESVWGIKCSDTMSGRIKNWISLAASHLKLSTELLSKNARCEKFKGLDRNKIGETLKAYFVKSLEKFAAG